MKLPQWVGGAGPPASPTGVRPQVSHMGGMCPYCRNSLVHRKVAPPARGDQLPGLNVAQY